MTRRGGGIGHETLKIPPKGVVNSVFFSLRGYYYTIPYPMLYIEQGFCQCVTPDNEVYGTYTGDAVAESVHGALCRTRLKG